MERKEYFYNRSTKSWLQDNTIEMYSLYNDRKSVLKIFCRNVKSNIKKYQKYKYQKCVY